MFRQTLLCHDNLSLNHSLRPELLKEFHLASPAKPQSENPILHDDTPETFSTSEHPKLTTRDPLMKAALHHLSQIYPLSLPYKKLLTEAERAVCHAQGRAHEDASAEGTIDSQSQLPTRLLNAHLSNLLELTLSPPPFTTTLSSHPIASPYAPHSRAPPTKKITNPRLETVQLTEPSRLVLTHLDGLHDKPALINIITHFIETHPPKNPHPTPTSPPQERAPPNTSPKPSPLFAKSAL